MLTRDEILALVPKSLADLPYEDVPAFGGTLRIRALGSDERDALEVESSKIREERGNNTGAIGFRARVVAWSACNEAGSRLFEFSDAEALGKADAATMDRLFNAADRLSGFTQSRTEDVKKN